MKRILYFSSISLMLFSCSTTKEIFYDDAYDEAAAPTKTISDDGYEDFIKDGERGNQVVLEENKPTKQNFGGFISNDDYTGTQYDRNCDCNYGYVRNPRNGTFYYDVFNGRPMQQGSYYHGSFNNYNYCPCNNDYGYLSGWYPCGFSLGYYSGWSYNSWVYNPYGYNLFGSDYLYSYYYGYYPYNSYYTNGYYNGNNTGNGSWFNGNDNNTTGNHFYGHRGTVSTESSNTTAYAHTIKGVATNPDLGSQDAVVVSQPISATPSFGIEKRENPTNAYGSTINSNVTVASTSTVTTNVSTGTRPANTTTNYSTQSNSITENIPASNQFGATTTPQGVSRTGNGSGTTTNTTNGASTNQGNNPGTYARYTNTTNTNATSSENSTTSTSRNGGYTNSTNSTNYNSSSNNSGSNSSSYSSHRSTTSSSSGSSSSSSSSTSGGSGTTSTSRR